MSAPEPSPPGALTLDEADLARISKGLGRTIDALVAGRSLADTAGLLIDTLEALPNAGRFAAFQALGPDHPMKLIASRSLSDAEVSAIAASIDTAELMALANDPDAAERGAPKTIIVPDAGDEPQQLFVYPIAFVEPPRVALIAMAREVRPDHEPEQFTSLLRQLARIAAIVLEDRRLRSEIRDVDELMAGVLSAVPEAVIRIDEAGVVQSYSRAAETMFGYAPAEIIGGPVTRLMAPEHADQHQDYIQAFEDTGMRRLPDFGRRVQARRWDGETFPIEIALSAFDFEGERQYVGVVRDVSRQLADERRLDELRRALEVAARHSALGELSASIAHELNQPLTAVANYMDAAEALLAAPGELDREALRRAILGAAGQARLGGEIVRRIRRLTRRGEALMAAGDFAGAVAEAVEFFRRSSMASGVDITVRHAGETRPVVFDRVQLQQVVGNLVANALQAVAEQDVRRVDVETKIGDDGAELTVADTGPGVPDERKSSIFDSFITHRAGGLGIGLAVSRRIAQAHGGRLTVEDAPSGGAVFRMTLPLAGKAEARTVET